MIRRLQGFHLPPHGYHPLRSSLFVLTDSFTYTDKHENVHAVPAGFHTDGASIPRFFWRIIGHPFGPYLAAAIVHDWYCVKATEAATMKECKRIRLQADVLFEEMLTWLGLPKPKVAVMYRGVRIGATFTKPLA